MPKELAILESYFIPKGLPTKMFPKMGPKVAKRRPKDVACGSKGTPKRGPKVVPKGPKMDPEKFTKKGTCLSPICVLSHYV